MVLKLYYWYLVALVFSITIIGIWWREFGGEQFIVVLVLYTYYLFVIVVIVIYYWYFDNYLKYWCIVLLENWYWYCYLFIVLLLMIVFIVKNIYCIIIDYLLRYWKFICITILKWQWADVYCNLFIVGVFIIIGYLLQYCIYY